VSPTKEQSFVIHASRDKVLGAIRNPGMIEESEKSRNALAVEIRDLEKTKTRHCYEIHVDQHAIGLTGVDTSKTEHNVTTVDFDLRTGSAHWSWKGGGQHSGRAKISGGYRVNDLGDDTELVLTVDINIPVPVVGKAIAKKVAAEFEKEWPKYVARAERWATRE